jgi:uncharacterized membrane protein HdeD (DUF308 family)
MMKDIAIRSRVLLVHALLSVGLGLFLIYLRGMMTDPLSEVVAVAIAIAMSAASLVLAAITDWCAALSEGMKHARRLIFYLLAGLFLALAGVIIGYYRQVTMEWLMFLGAGHALVFGILAFAVAFKVRHHPMERRSMFALGTISVAFF